MDDWSKRLVLVPQRYHQMSGLYSAPKTTAKYLEYKKDWPDVVAIVGKDTRIKVTKLKKHGAVGWGYSVFPFAEVMDGPWKGKTVDLSDLSVYSEQKIKEIVLLKPNLEMLGKQK